MADIGAQEQRTPQTYSTEVYPLNNRNWEKIVDEVEELEKQAFGDTAFTKDVFEDAFEQKEAVLILLKDGNRIIGFTFSTPFLYLKDDLESDMADIPREDNGEKTAYIMDTVIQPDFRGKGLVGKMMQGLEEELVKRGWEFMERDASTANNYAENIAKHYKSEGRLIYQAPEPHDSDWGPQIFFRIKLPQPPRVTTQK